MRSRLEPLAAHNGLDRVRRRGDDVRPADRVLVGVDRHAADLLRERFGLCAVATCNADLVDRPHAWDRARVSARLNAGADQREHARIVAGEQPRRERRTGGSARRRDVRPVHQREGRAVVRIEDADDGLMRLSIGVMGEERHELAREASRGEI